MGEERHIVIVGGGIIGASIGYYLTRHASRPAVTLLEASKDVAPGASGKAGGFLALDWHPMPTSSLGSLSFRLHKELAEKDNGAELWGYRQVETHQLSLDTSRKPRTRPSLDWLNPDVFISSGPIGGGGTTAQVTPGLLTRHLVQQAQAQGLKLRLQTKATGLELDENDKVKSVRVTSEGKEETIPATDVVLAAGPWTGKLVSSLFAKDKVPSFLRSAMSIKGDRAHSIIIKAAKEHQLSADCFFTEMRYGTSAGAPELYNRPKGLAYVCGATDDAPLPELADEVTYDSKATAELQRQAAVVSPEYLDVKKGADLKAEQACYLPLCTRTASPILGGSGDQGIYVAAGHAVWGINNSLGTGLVMSELILDGKAKSADIRQLKP